MWEATFPMPSYCPPLGYVALSHLVHIPMPLHSFVLQLPSPSCCVWCQLDKFSFFFSPFILNLCRTMSTAISPSPPPTPITATSTLLLPPHSCSCYNCPHATPCTDPHMRRRAHTSHLATIALTVHIVF